MWPAIQSFRLRDAIDILLVALVLYRVFVMFKETRAVQMMLGLGALMAGSFLAHRFELYGTSWILDNFWSFWVLALIVLWRKTSGAWSRFYGQACLAFALFVSEVRRTDLPRSKRKSGMIMG